MIISTHSHLAAQPQDLQRLVDSGVFQQIWLLHTWYAYDELQQTEISERATQGEILAVCRKYPHFFVPFAALDFTQPPDHIDRLFQAGFVGLKRLHRKNATTIIPISSIMNEPTTSTCQSFSTPAELPLEENMSERTALSGKIP